MDWLDDPGRPESRRFQVSTEKEGQEIYDIMNDPIFYFINRQNIFVAQDMVRSQVLRVTNRQNIGRLQALSRAIITTYVRIEYDTTTDYYDYIWDFLIVFAAADVANAERDIRWNPGRQEGRRFNYKYANPGPMPPVMGQMQLRPLPALTDEERQREISDARSTGGRLLHPTITGPITYQAGAPALQQSLQDNLNQAMQTRNDLLANTTPAMIRGRERLLADFSRTLDNFGFRVPALLRVIIDTCYIVRRLHRDADPADYATTFDLVTPALLDQFELPARTAPPGPSQT